MKHWYLTVILLILLKITLSLHLFCQHSLENEKIMCDVSLNPKKKNLRDFYKTLNLLIPIMHDQAGISPNNVIQYQAEK